MSDFARMMELAGSSGNPLAVREALGEPAEAATPTPAEMPKSYGPGRRDAEEEHPRRR